MASGLTKTQLVRYLAEKTELPNKTAQHSWNSWPISRSKETKKKRPVLSCPVSAAW